MQMLCFPFDEKENAEMYTFAELEAAPTSTPLPSQLSRSEACKQLETFHNAENMFKRSPLRYHGSVSPSLQRPLEIARTWPRKKQ